MFLHQPELLRLDGGGMAVDVRLDTSFYLDTTSSYDGNDED